MILIDLSGKVAVITGGIQGLGKATAAMLLRAGANVAVNYSSAKAGVIAFTKVLSRELASRRINVNAVAPGVVLTEMGASIPDAAREQMLTQIPMKRFGDPDEIASVILYLCSDLSSYVTGQTLHVNGGWWG